MNIEPLTDEEMASWPTDVKIDLDGAFEDERGAIKPLVDAMMKSAVMITSKKGTVRANHYHKTDWHYCYVIKGSIDYFHRPHGSDQSPEKVVVGVGEMMFTPPLVDHAMVFTEDTMFLTLGRNPRDQASYESDVERITLVEG